MFFWNSLAFSIIQWMLAIWSLVPLPFLKPACFPSPLEIVLSSNCTDLQTWGFLVPLSDPQIGKSDEGPRTFESHWELLCYSCSPVWASPTWRLYGRAPGSMLGLMSTHCISQDCCCHCSCPHSRPLLTHTSSGDPETLTGRPGSVSCGGHYSFLLGPGAHKILFMPSKSLWQVCGLILTWLCPSYHLVVTSSLSLDVGYLFLVDSNILLSVVVQLLVGILMFSLEEKGAHPSTRPCPGYCK